MHDNSQAVFLNDNRQTAQKNVIKKIANLNWQKKHNCVYATDGCV